MIAAKIWKLKYTIGFWGFYKILNSISAIRALESERWGESSEPPKTDIFRSSLLESNICKFAYSCFLSHESQNEQRNFYNIHWNILHILQGISIQASSTSFHRQQYFFLIWGSRISPKYQTNVFLWNLTDLDLKLVVAPNTLAHKHFSPIKCDQDPSL